MQQVYCLLLADAVVGLESTPLACNIQTNKVYRVEERVQQMEQLKIVIRGIYLDRKSDGNRWGLQFGGYTSYPAMGFHQLVVSRSGISGRATNRYFSLEHSLG